MNKDIMKTFIIQEMKNGDIRKKYFPMITDIGIRDYSEAVHSSGLNYLTQIGREINRVVALSEYPIYPVSKTYTHTTTRIVRSDSVWFAKQTFKPLLIAEFERYEGSKQKNRKLKEKIENLLLSYHQLGAQIPLLLFVYWTYNDGTIAKNIETYLRIFDEGFSLNGQWIPGINTHHTDYLVFQAVAQGTKEHLIMNQWIKVR
ncbi:hypothetical protein [Priestia megaterium]|uniref:hypothetical protein n=1 Tax=Priestia megaterium TaxID=1404 RepID=UPI0030099831